jgi:hypothetical protein
MLTASWLIIVIPYLGTIAFLVVLHVIDSRSLRRAFNGPTKSLNS